MAIFMGRHKVPADFDANQSWSKYKESSEKLGLKPIRVIYNTEAGFAYCQTEAESIEQVKQAHDNAQLVFEEIVEIKELD